MYKRTASNNDGARFRTSYRRLNCWSIRPTYFIFIFTTSPADLRTTLQDKTTSDDHHAVSQPSLCWDFCKPNLQVGLRHESQSSFSRFRPFISKWQLQRLTFFICTSKNSVSPVKILISRRKSLTLPTLRVSVYGTTIINVIDQRKPSNTEHLQNIVQVQKFNGLFMDLGTLPRRMAFPAFRPSGWYG